MSQKEKVKKYLKEGHSITALEALNYFGAMRLSAIIYDLRREGMDIKTHNFHDKKNDKRYAKYYLPQNQVEVTNLVGDYVLKDIIDRIVWKNIELVVVPIKTGYSVAEVLRTGCQIIIHRTNETYTANTAKLYIKKILEEYMPTHERLLSYIYANKNVLFVLDNELLVFEQIDNFSGFLKGIKNGIIRFKRDLELHPSFLGKYESQETYKRAWKEGEYYLRIN